MADNTSEVVANDSDVTRDAPGRGGPWMFVAFAVALTLAFAGPLVALARRSLGDDLTSHALLVPFISGYLIWLSRDRLARAGGAGWWLAIPLAIAGLALLGLATKPEDQLSARILAFVVLLWAGGFAFLGGPLMWAYAFPALFLVFMVPLPSGAVAALETFFQHTSAEVAFRFIDWSGTTVFREGLTFAMPGLTVFVGPECSGIRSSFALFMTSLLAGHLFLSSIWRRLALALFVIPLGIVRNAFRVFVLSMLSVHVDPWYIESPLHHRGGPIFFVLSLVPFFVFLWWLRRRER
jgi:exosortase C (VPDSG-CTERM-specific)